MSTRLPEFGAGAPFCPVGDAIVRARPRAAVRLVVARRMEAVGQHDAHDLLFDVAPEARASKAEMADRARAELRSRERTGFALAVETRPQRARGSRADQRVDLGARQKIARSIVEDVDDGA